MSKRRSSERGAGESSGRASKLHCPGISGNNAKRAGPFILGKEACWSVICLTYMWVYLKKKKECSECLCKHAHLRRECEESSRFVFVLNVQKDSEGISWVRNIFPFLILVFFFFFFFKVICRTTPLLFAVQSVKQNINTRGVNWSVCLMSCRKTGATTARSLPFGRSCNCSLSLLLQGLAWATHRCPV